ncbi:hypothetical protein AB7M45_007900 [Bradyrhizobium elkanii]|uniref:hypothetical protein n=1 Tax=Bradyrhizobium elkanii TaxID=29448 RepID=UPI00091050E6|nr:hypothetical protein [Bradyrhizobium elkanii]MCW2195129.1 hypothetical protein [Bradyrhizobium elkanii]NWL67182.1 hypothetical protein [Bradyrhizobium elkanii]OIM93228.1 hypothetical protein BLN97_17645 [Bradyrhizobium elkanii]
MKRALTILNETGDVTITWEAENDERMLPIIERKMKSGVTFFLIEPRMNGLVAPDTSKPLKKVKDALKHRALSMKDEDFETMVAEGKAELVQTPAAPARTIRKASTAREVVKSESVGVQQMRGG